MCPDRTASTPAVSEAEANPSTAGVENGRLRSAWPVLVSVTLAVVLVPAVGYGLFSPDAYLGNGHALVLASRAQDVLTALVLPVLVWAGMRSRGGSLSGHVLWLGLLFYLAYSYAIYLIGWQHNRGFLVYAVVVLLSAAALVDGLVRVDPVAVRPLLAALHTRGLGWFLVVVGVAFTALWLGDVAPSAFGGRPPGHLGPGGTPYAVYVLDLVVALPTVMATGVMLVRRHPVAPVLGGVVLVKVTTLFTALWLGVVAQLLDGREVPFTADMVPSAVLPVVTVTVLLRWSRRVPRRRGGWVREQLWAPCPSVESRG
jgi:hypothetical protein